MNPNKETAWMYCHECGRFEDGCTGTKTDYEILDGKPPCEKYFYTDAICCFATYEQHVLRDFIEQYPDYEGNRLEVTEQGKVFVHGNSAYPLIIDHAPSYEDWLKTL